jgi:hypothetical protein
LPPQAWSPQPSLPPFSPRDVKACSYDGPTILFAPIVALDPKQRTGEQGFARSPWSHTAGGRGLSGGFDRERYGSDGRGSALSSGDPSGGGGSHSGGGLLGARAEDVPTAAGPGRASGRPRTVGAWLDALKLEGAADFAKAFDAIGAKVHDLTDLRVYSYSFFLKKMIIIKSLLPGAYFVLLTHYSIHSSYP